MEDNHTPLDPILPGSLAGGMIEAGQAPSIEAPEDEVHTATLSPTTTDESKPVKRSRGIPAWIKGVLDLAMVLVLALLYNRNVLGGMALHEIAGLALAGVFLLHVLLNARWVGTMTRRLRSRETPILMKVRYAVSALLAVLFLVIVVTGLFINRTLLPGLRLQGQLWQVLHTTVSYWTLAVAGVHIGLHWQWVMGLFRKLFRLHGAPGPARVWIARLLAVAVFGWGIFAAISEHYPQKLVLSAGAMTMAHGMPGPDGLPYDGAVPADGQFPGDGQLPGDGHLQRDGQASADGQLPADGQTQSDGQASADGQLPADGQTQSDGQASADGQLPADGHLQRDGQAPADGMTPPDGTDSRNGSGKDFRGGRGAPPDGMRPDGMRPGDRNGFATSAGTAGLPMTLAIWLGILAAFAVPTHYITALCNHRRKKHAIPLAPAA